MTTTTRRRATELDRVIGRRIREARKLRALPMKRVAEMIGMSYQQIEKYERGQNRISAGTLCRIADALVFAPDYFLRPGIDGEPPIDTSAATILRNYHRMNHFHRKLLVKLSATLAAGGAR